MKKSPHFALENPCSHRNLGSSSRRKTSLCAQMMKLYGEI